MPLPLMSPGFDGLDDALRLSQTIVGLMSDSVVIVLDLDLRVVLMDGALLARHGYDVRAHVGRDVRDVVPAPQWSVLGEHWVAALAGEPRTLDWASADDLRDYWLHFAPLRTKSGEIVGAISVAQDITERVRAREQVEQRLTQQVAAPVGWGATAFGSLVVCSRRPDAFSEDDLGFVESTANILMAAVERERALARATDAESQMAEFWELSLDLLAIFSADGRFLKVSGAWEQTLGWTPQELIGRPALELIVPEDRQATVADAAAAAVAGESVPEVVNRFRARDGSSRWLLWSVRTGPDGTLYSVAKDITERHEERAQALRREEQLRLSEQRFRQGFDHAPIGMTLVDAKTFRYLSVNDAFCELVGRTRAALMALTFSDLSHPDDIVAEQTSAERLADSTLDNYTTEKRYLRPDGSEVWASLHVTPVRDVDGGVDVLFAQMVDITERRAKEASLRAQFDEISWLGEIRRAFEEDRFELHAQPIVDLATGQIVQRELLIRMRGVDGDLIAPGAFLPAAEQHGAIRDIDRWVIAQGADLAARGIDVEINISAASIGDPGLIADIEQELERTGADPSRLVFEITRNRPDRGHRPRGHARRAPAATRMPLRA